MYSTYLMYQIVRIISHLHDNQALIRSIASFRIMQTGEEGTQVDPLRLWPCFCFRRLRDTGSEWWCSCGRTEHMSNLIICLLDRMAPLIRRCSEACRTFPRPLPSFNTTCQWRANDFVMWTRTPTRSPAGYPTSRTFLRWASSPLRSNEPLLYTLLISYEYRFGQLLKDLNVI